MFYRATFLGFHMLETWWDWRNNLQKPSLDYQVFVNFRPISNHKMVSKVIEKIVASRLTSNHDENNLREPFQSAYKRETALIRVQNDIFSWYQDMNVFEQT